MKTLKIEEVKIFRAPDGRTFNTREEAVRHCNETLLKQQIIKVLSAYLSSCSSEVISDVAEALALDSKFRSELSKCLNLVEGKPKTRRGRNKTPEGQKEAEAIAEASLPSPVVGSNNASLEKLDTPPFDTDISPEDMESINDLGDKMAGFDFDSAPPPPPEA